MSARTDAGTRWNGSSSLNRRSTRLAASCCHPLFWPPGSQGWSCSHGQSPPRRRRETCCPRDCSCTLNRRDKCWSRGLSLRLVHTLHGHGGMSLTNHLKAVCPDRPVRWDTHSCGTAQAQSAQDQRESGRLPHLVSSSPQCESGRTHWNNSVCSLTASGGIILNM